MKEGKKATVYYTAHHIDHLKTMLEALWHPLLATFSIVLEEATEPKFWKLSLQGFLSCIKIACRFQMTLELEIFLSSLAKFTSLIYLHNQISEKNIDCMKILLEIAKFEANYLRGSWLHVLKCLSKLDHLHLISSGVQYDGPITETDLISSESISIQITPADIDYIFNMSAGLDDDAIIEFVTKLIEVSRDELWGSHPRTFCLQALINVADVNMNRMRYVWSRVWKTLKDHFSQAGLHKSQFIASFAIDSLKQLAIKFLQKEEFENFRFQKDFLQPFEVIMKCSTNLSVKELIVACMSTFVFTVGHNIKSGWDTIISVLQLSTSEVSTCIIDQAFNATQRICEKHLANVMDHSQQICSILISFGGSSLESVSIKSLEVMGKCSNEYVKLPGDYWKILIVGIGEVIKDNRSNVKNAAITTLFTTLSQGSYSEDQLATVYREIFVGIFEGFKPENMDKDWISSTCCQALYGMASLINEKYDLLHSIIPEYFSLITAAVLTLNESLAKIALAVLKLFITSNFTRFTEELWTQATSSVEKLAENCTPTELFLPVTNNKLAFEPRLTSDKTVILHHLLINIREILNFQIPESSTIVLIGVFEPVYEFSRRFNRDFDVRKGLWQAGFMAGNKTLPGMFRIERDSLIIVLELINRTEEQRRAYRIAKYLIGDVVNKESLFSERKEEITALEQVVSRYLLPGIGKNVREAMEEIGNELVDLVVVADIGIREELKKLFKSNLKSNSHV